MGGAEDTGSAVHVHSPELFDEFTEEFESLGCLFDEVYEVHVDDLEVEGGDAQLLGLVFYEGPVEVVSLHVLEALEVQNSFYSVLS